MSTPKPPTQLLLINTRSKQRRNNPVRLPLRTTRYYSEGILKDDERSYELLQTLRPGFERKLTYHEEVARWLALSNTVRTCAMKTFGIINARGAFIKGRPAQWYELPGYMPHPSQQSINYCDQHHDRILMLADFIRKFPYRSEKTGQIYSIRFIIKDYHFKFYGIDTVRQFRLNGIELNEEYYGDYGDSKPWRRYGYLWNSDAHFARSMSACAKWVRLANRDAKLALDLWYTDKVEKHRLWVKTSGKTTVKRGKYGTQVIRKREPTIPGPSRIRSMLRDLKIYIELQDNYVWSLVSADEVAKNEQNDGDD